MPRPWIRSCTCVCGSRALIEVCVFAVRLIRPRVGGRAGSEINGERRSAPSAQCEQGARASSQQQGPEAAVLSLQRQAEAVASSLQRGCSAVSSAWARGCSAAPLAITLGGRSEPPGSSFLFPRKRVPGCKDGTALWVLCASHWGRNAPVQTGLPTTLQGCRCRDGAFVPAHIGLIQQMKSPRCDYGSEEAGSLLQSAFCESESA